MLKIKSATPIEKIERNGDKWRYTFSFEIESKNDLRTPEIKVEASGEGVRKICSEISSNDQSELDDKLLECWSKKVKTLWLSLDEEFVFAKENHEHIDYSDASDFERLSQRSNDGSYPL